MIEEIRTNRAEPNFTFLTSDAEEGKRSRNLEERMVKMKYPFSENGIRFFLEDIFQSAWKLCGSECKARSATGAISWYINTGRAPTAFIRAMMRRRPSTIAKRCLAGGSDQEIIDRIKKLVDVW